MADEPFYVSSDEETVDGEEIVIEGLRRTRNRTNWRYRGSSITTTDRLDIEAMQLQAADFELALASIGAAFTALAIKAKSRLEQSLPILKLKAVMDYLCIAVAWITCYLEMIYLDIEDRLFFQHQRRTFPAPQYRRISSIQDNNQSEEMFGFKIQELELLRAHWRIPQVMRNNGRVFDGEEAMLVFLYYIRTGIPFTRMADTVFGGDPRLFTNFVREIADHLYLNFYHKMSGDSMRQWVPFIDDFRAGIWDKMLNGLVSETRRGGPTIDWEVYVPFNQFRIFGFLDDTDLKTDRPRPGRSIENNSDLAELRDTQVAFYK